MAHVQSNRAYRPRCEHALMSGHEPGTDGDDPLIDEAAAWLAKLRLSSGPREREAFETWYAADRAHADAYDRSEEHTSELQSLMRISYAVFCLKKKKKKQ